MTPHSGAHTSSHAGEAVLMVGLVQCQVNDLTFGVHIPNVARVFDSLHVVDFPRPRPSLLSLARVDVGLIPVIDLSAAFGLGPTRDRSLFVLAEDKEFVFAFPVGLVESVIQMRADRIRYPRAGEVRLDRDLLRGYWRVSGQRNGYILNCAAVYRRVLGDAARTLQNPASELHA